MTSRVPNINRSRVHEDMVQKLAVQKLNDAQRAIFPTIRELLCFAAILGFSENRRIPLDKDKGVEDISYQQFERGDSEDLIYLIALAESKDANILRDGNENSCAEIFEEYVNGGLQVIEEALVRGGGEYPDRDIMEMLREKGHLQEDGSRSEEKEIIF